ncbi:MAG: hypothetical protein ACKVJU_00915 [Verrucomicrobiales bacterium]
MQILCIFVITAWLAESVSGFSEVRKEDEKLKQIRGKIDVVRHLWSLDDMRRVLR